jgi:hypothetical protein
MAAIREQLRAEGVPEGTEVDLRRCRLALLASERGLEIAHTLYEQSAQIPHSSPGTSDEDVPSALDPARLQYGLRELPQSNGTNGNGHH